MADRPADRSRQADPVYCCGPEPLLAAVRGWCAAWPPGALHVEHFAAAPAAVPVGEPVERAGFEVLLRRSGLRLRVPAGRSILEVVEAAGVPVLSSCREGTCGSCETGVLAGVPDHRDGVLTAADRDVGDVMMICVSRSHTPCLTLDL